ncbi:hypothetical protein AVEN_161099-1, partial [Araneus ventricosus]
MAEESTDVPVITLEDDEKEIIQNEKEDSREQIPSEGDREN